MAESVPVDELCFCSDAVFLLVLHHLNVSFAVIQYLFPDLAEQLLGDDLSFCHKIQLIPASVIADEYDKVAQFIPESDDCDMERLVVSPCELTVGGAI